MIDLRNLSQSELTSLSHCSDKSFDLRRCDDVIIPKIDRSVFNESAGSRKQTYSHLRLAPRQPEISAVGRGRYNPVPKPHTNPVDDPERKENKQIVSILRGLFGDNSDIKFKDPNDKEKLEMIVANHEPVLSLPSQEAVVVPEGGVKRKRGRPRKDRTDVVNFVPIVNNDMVEPQAPNPKVRRVEGGDDYYENVQINENVAMEIVNKNGMVVDLAALADSEDPYGPELRRRSGGLTTEEDLLVFLRGLEGQWGSRRKKRKVVDASDFGDALPIGWKILISLKRKEGNLSLYCRRYISPTGQQFVTCKEVSSYLLPFFGFQDENHPNSFQSGESDNEANKLSSGSSAGPAYKNGSTKYEMISYDASSSPIVSVSSEHEKQNPLLGTDNLAEVEIRDLLECHICNMNFDEKDAYLRHLLSSHQKTAKRPRHGNTSVCDGVIIRDGKFECQFCHKIFEERHRYNGHVGVHVRNYVRSLELSPNLTSENNVKPSVSGILLKSSEIEASAGTNGGSAAVTCKPCNESSSLNGVKSVSVSSVLPTVSGVEKSDEIEKGSVPLISMHSDEGTTQNNVNPSYVSGVFPEFSEVEASASMVKGSVPLNSIPCDEGMIQNNVKAEASTSLEKGSVPLMSMPRDEGMIQNDVKPASASGVLPGLSEVEASGSMEKGSVPLMSTPSDEGTAKNNVMPSSVSGVLPGFLEVEVSASMEKSSISATSFPSKESTMHINEKPLSVNRNLGLSEVETSDNIDKEASASMGKITISLTSLPSNEATIQNNAKPLFVSRDLGMSEVETSDNIAKLSVPLTSAKTLSVSRDLGITEVDTPANFGKVSVPLSSSPGSEGTKQDNTMPSSFRGVLPGVSGVEALAATDSGSVPPASSPKNEPSTEDNRKLSSVTKFLPELFESETPADNLKASVLPKSVVNNEISIDSPCKQPDLDSNLEGCTSNSSSKQSSPHRNSDVRIYNPLCSLARSKLVNLESPCDNTGSGSIPENSTSPSNIELNVNSPCSEEDVLAGKIDESLSGKSGDDLPDYGQNSPYSAPDTGGCTSQSSLDNSNVEIDSSRINLGLGPVPENPTSMSDFGLNVGSPCSQQDVLAYKSEQDVQTYRIDEAGGKSGDKQDTDNAMTDGEMYKLDRNYYDMNVDLRPCLDYTSALCNNAEDSTLEIFKGKDALTSEIEGKLCKLDQGDNDLDCDSKSYFGPANALHFNLGSANDLHNNFGNGTNVNFKRNNVFTSSAAGVNFSGRNQGESSFCFSFAPFGTQKNNGGETSKDEGFSTNVKDTVLDRSKGYGIYEPERCFGVNTSQYRESSGCFPTTLDLMSNKGQGESGNCFFGVKNSELDKGKGYVFNEPERSFGTNIGQSNLNFFREGTGSADRSMLQRSVADTSLTFLQPPSCFSTLDLMSNKSSDCFTTLELMPNKSPGGFSSLEFPSNKGQGGLGNFSLQKFDNMSGFDELGLDDLDPSKFGFVAAKESSSLAQEPMDITYDSVMEEALNTSAQFGWDTVIPKMNNNQQQTTICMWCRIPFNHEPINLEMQSDSVGFMCPTCKAKISGQLNIFGQ